MQGNSLIDWLYNSGGQLCIVSVQTLYKTSNAIVKHQVQTGYTIAEGNYVLSQCKLYTVQCYRIVHLHLPFLPALAALGGAYTKVKVHE